MIERDAEQKPSLKNVVLHANEIKVGRHYIAVDNIGEERIKVLTEPHLLKHLPGVEGLFIDVEVDVSRLSSVRGASVPAILALADFGIIRDLDESDGNLNNTCHLLRIE